MFKKAGRGANALHEEVLLHHASWHPPGTSVMSGETFSVVLWCWHDLRTDAMQVRMVNSDSGEEIHVEDGAFLLRIWKDEHDTVYRCLLRHLASGREAYLQGGPNLRAFVKACLAGSESAGQTPPETLGQ